MIHDPLQMPNGPQGRALGDDIRQQPVFEALYLVL